MGKLNIVPEFAQMTISLILHKEVAALKSQESNDNKKHFVRVQIVWL